MRRIAANFAKPARLLRKYAPRASAMRFAKLMNAAAIAPRLVLQLEQLPCLPH
jgi:hypothetical protein